MKTLIATAVLTIMFLSAGAFAGSNAHYTQPSLVVDAAHTTVINKNMAWPLPGRISVDACQISRCIDI